jgi:murein DD-endopeptidase MepM/ murein hydrolase activator NlpD
MWGVRTLAVVSLGVLLALEVWGGRWGEVSPDPSPDVTLESSPTPAAPDPAAGPGAQPGPGADRAEPLVAPPAAGAAPDRPRTTETELRRRETLESAFLRSGIARSDAALIIAALRPQVDMRQMRPGERLFIEWDAADRPAAVTHWRSPVERHEARRDGEQWTARRIDTPVETQVVALAGVLEGSLFQSIDRLGESAALTAKLVSLFEWDFDFAADSMPGDRFRALFEKRYAAGEFVGYGDVLVAQYQSAERPPLTAVGFRDGTGPVAYYDAQGRSVRKMFLRAPLDFTRITSGYAQARRHPILGGLRPHLAIDYGAPTGTPVRAVADGGVESAGWNGGYGYSVVIRHARGYKTMYNHLSKLHVRRGQHVRQRDVIGRVGSTGLSTGPHLDYRVMKNGQFVNPLGEKFIPGAPVPPERRPTFQAHLRALLDRLDDDAPVTSSASAR